MSKTAISETEVRQFIDDWFARLDKHVSVEEVLPMVANESLVMKLPEVTAYGHQGFIEWYERVIKKFFDEVHTIKALKITPSNNMAKVEMVLQWQTSIWKAPDAKSTRLDFYVAQTWEIQRSPTTQKLIIVAYNVDYFIPLEESDDA
jgi:hypothetical protein